MLTGLVLLAVAIQLYATQFLVASGGWQLRPLADPERVDDRRRQAALEPSADYRRRFESSTSTKVKNKPPHNEQEMPRPRLLAGARLSGEQAGSPCQAKVRDAAPASGACLVHDWSTRHRSRAVRNGLRRYNIRAGGRCDPGTTGPSAEPG